MLDPIHGRIDFDESNDLYWRIIDTVDFQRLRDIKQNGTLSIVFPGAVHSRFQHSIGVGFLARNVSERIRRTQRDLDVTLRDSELVGIAGLVHDIGHGPFSHLLEKRIAPALGIRGWKHENMSNVLFDRVIADAGIDIDEQEVRFVRNAVLGEKSGADGKRFLFDIVANQRNSLDVDKVDYIARDTLYIGTRRGEFFELFKSCRVINDEICFQKEDMFSIYQLFGKRFELHKSFYTHPTAQAAELMVCDALIHAEKTLNLKNSLQDPEDFVHCTDSIMKLIEISKDPELKTSKEILKNLYQRKMYKLAAQKHFGSLEELRILLPDLENYDTLLQDIEACQDSNQKAFSSKDIHVYPFRIDFGMKDINPLSKVGVYSSPNEKIECDILSFAPFLSNQCMQWTLRIYCKEPNATKIQAIQEAFIKVLELRMPRYRDSSDFSPLLSTPIKKLKV
jgi:HD superfamily phosphohydrolase